MEVRDMSTWGVSVSDVLNATGRNVSLADIYIAGEIIDIFSNRTESASGAMRKRDIEWIKKAVAWQAPKVTDDPDLVSKLTAAFVKQDDVEVHVEVVSQWVLSPLAARALKNLSWKGSRSIDLSNARTALGSLRSLNFLNEQSDESTEWNRDL